MNQRGPILSIPVDWLSHHDLIIDKPFEFQSFDL